MTHTFWQRRYLRTMFVLCLCLVPSLILSSGQVTNSSTMPRLVMYSGVVKDTSGKTLTGTVGVTFALYKEQESGSPLWLETQNVQADPRGRFSVYLGATKPDGLPQDLFVSGEARWLGVRPDGQGEQPRVQLITVPYAMKAGDAETIGGLPPSAFMLATPATAGGSAAPAPSSSSGSAAPIAPPLAGSGTLNFVPLWTPDGNTLGNSVLFQSGTGSTAKVGVNTNTPVSTLDVKGGGTIRGTLNLPATGTATATGGKSSQVLLQTASSFSSGTNAAVTQNFRWQAEPTGNNTTSPGGTLNLLFSSGNNPPAETGLHIASNGQITFAAGQTFPGTGNGTITGVSAGTDLTGGGSSGSVTLNLDTTKVPQLNSTNTFGANQSVNGTVTATSFSGNGSGLTNLQGSNVQGNVGTANNALNLGGLPPSSYQLAGSYATLGANTFTGNQSVLGNISSNAQVSGSTVNAATGFYIGGNPFDYGSLNTANEFFGFAGNQTMTGADNVATGQASFVTNTTGNYNTADGIASLKLNDAGSSNSAVGFSALFNNAGGNSNTAVGANALQTNTTGSNNTALGANAGSDSAHPALTNATAIGANAQVTASNAMVLGSINGVNGATADTNVGIGTTSPTAKLDVRGTANFGGLVSFAAGQTFPGTGTITGVTAGSGLSGGGTSGAVTLNLNNAYTDGRYAQLAANNTFSGVQTINNSVGIGTSPNPVFALQTIGTIRSETGGLSIGGSAPVAVDAPFISGGRFTILPNGNVGINNPNPTTNLDVQGNIDARGTLIGQSLNVAGGGVINGGITTSAGISTGAGIVDGGPLSVSGATSLAGSLTIKGDPPMNAAPRMTFSGFFPGFLTSGDRGGAFVPSKDITITRMTFDSGGSAILCSPPGSIAIIKPTNPGIQILFTQTVKNEFPGYGDTFTDSGPISIPVSANTPMYFQVWDQPVCGLNPGPNNVHVNVEYVMQ